MCPLAHLPKESGSNRRLGEAAASRSAPRHMASGSVSTASARLSLASKDGLIDEIDWPKHLEVLGGIPGIRVEMIGLPEIRYSSSLEGNE